MIRMAVRVGNSAGVILPKKYLGSIVEIGIKSLNKKEIKKQILNIVEPYLNYIMGIYLVGSYARNEQTLDSDVDVVIVTTKKIRLTKIPHYHLICVDYKELIKELNKNIIAIYPMLMEAEVILNEELLKTILIRPITKNGLEWHLKTTKSALKIIEESLLTKEKDLIINPSIIYSLVLRLREIYLVDCMLNKKIGSIKGLIEYSKQVKSIKVLYEAYKGARDKECISLDIKVDDVKELYNFVKERLRRQEKIINEIEEKKAVEEKNNWII